MTSKEALIIFVKNPELGKAKTRIAKTEGNEKALEIYKELLTYTRNVTLKVSCNRYIFYTYFIDETDNWLAESFNKQLQINGNLGQKMQAAFTHCFNAGAKKVVVIGSDCGDLKPKHIQQAFSKLNDNELIIGPAEDGGYYLLGMTKPHYFVFKNKQWSTPTLYQITTAEIKEKQLPFTTLETLNDIDNIDDYNRWENKKAR